MNNRDQATRCPPVCRSAGLPVNGPTGRREDGKTSAGFTLVEMMLVVVIIGVLAAMVVPRLASRPQQAKIARAKADIGVIGTSIDLFHFDLDAYPEQLEDLVTHPSGDTEEQWKGPYLKGGVPKDPWGRLYVYNKKSAAGNPDYELYSLGPDGQPGNDDVTLE